MNAGPWRERLYRRRWWLVAIAVLIIVRAALPEVLRRVIASQASEALGARVDVGDVDLRLWRGGVALEDVAVREKGAPEPPPPAEEADPDSPPPPAFDEYSPIVGFRRFAVELHYLPLFQKTIQLRDIALEGPRVSLDRLSSGDLNLMALVPKQEVAVEAGAAPAAAATPTAAPATGETGETSEPWKVGLDKFVLSDGRIRFRDLALEGSEPVELGIDRISVDEVALSPAVYGKPGRIHLKLGVDEGVIDVDAQLTLNGAEASVVTDVTANRLPLRRARLYVPDVGWSELKGELDLGLTYRLEPEKTNELSGTLGLRDVSVAVPSLEDVAVGWKSLAVTLESIDLLAQRAAVRQVTLDGAVVVVRTLGEMLPVLARKSAPATVAATPDATPAGEVAAETGSPAPAPTDTPVSPAATEVAATPLEATPLPTSAPDAGEATPATSAPPTVAEAATPGETIAAPAAPSPVDAAPAKPPAEPWGWELGEITITSSKLRVLSDGPPLDVGVDLAARGLSGDAGAVGHVTLGLAVPPGTVALDGDVRIAPSPAFGGTLKIADLSLPALPAVRMALPPEALPSANLRSDLAITAGLPARTGGEAPADRLGLSGTLGIAALKLAPPAAPGLSIDLQDLELRIDRLSVPGVLPPGQKAAAGAAIELAAGLTLSEPRVTRAGEQALAVAAETIALELPSLAVPAVLAGLAPGDGVPMLGGALGLDLEAPRVALGNDDLTVQAGHVALRITDATLPVLPPAAPPSGSVPAHDSEPPVAAATTAPPTKLSLQLDLSQPAVATAQGKELNAGAETIALQLTDVVVPGFVAGAPLSPSSEPLRAKATLRLAEPRVARGDGKEFAVSAKSISVPLQSIELPGVPGGTPPGGAMQPLRASFGEIRLEGPAIRATRRKEGMVVPATGAAPGPAATPAAAPTPTAAPSPAATQPLELQIAALRIVHGSFEFTDRAVQPVFSTRFAPIEVDARNIALPGPRVKPLNIDITSAEQGKITLRGDIAPDASTLTLKVDQLALAPFNPYAATYSPYSIADGALTIEMKADARGGKYEVKNDITLHQFDLAGAEGDSLFEQNFGISLSMALALLRDVQGDIDLAVPLQVDREGNAQVDVMAVVRSALRQAITGAITSPLKMLGAVAGGKGAPIAPAPVAFRLGRAEPTQAGNESAERLAAFLASRPGMGVELSTAATAEDARWLHEHALLGEWAEEGVFQRSLAFVTARGPRQRIRAYLEARVEDEKPELSAEDAATLDEWLAERPAPTADELQALASARLAAVEAVLGDKGIDASRVSRGAPPPEPSTPVVGIKLRAAAARPAADASPHAGGDTED